MQPPYDKIMRSPKSRDIIFAPGKDAISKTMPKKEIRKKLEFRYYTIPAGEYILPMLGKGWEQEYGYGYDGTLHFHNYLEIGYCYHGKGTLIIEDREYRYGDHMYTFIPANIPHTTISDEGNICKWEFLFIDLNTFIDDAFRESVLTTEEIKRIVNKRGTLKSMANHPNTGRVILDLIRECRHKEPYYQTGIEGYLRVLVTEILRLDEERERARQPKSGENVIRPALQYVEKHYAEEIRIEDLSAICSLSESHFRRMFVHTVNMKPVDYINLVRIHHACTLIRKENLPMEDIAYRVGYQTVSTFNRNFKKITGATPYQWKVHGSEWDVSGFNVTAMRGWEGTEGDHPVRSAL